MRRLLTQIALVLAIICGTANGHGGGGGDGQHRQSGHGLIGFGISMDEPVCLFACRAILRTNRLSCSASEHDDDDDRRSAVSRRHGAHEAGFETEPDCFASDRVFLNSVAACIQARCANHTSLWRIERFWARDLVGDRDPQPRPAYPYGEAINQLDEVPRPIAHLDGVLKNVSDVSADDWKLAFSTLTDDAYTEKRHSMAGMLLVGLTIVAPILIHLMRLVQLPGVTYRRTITWLGQSALFGQRHSVPLPYNFGIVPTCGQALFITLLILLNLVLLSTGYQVEEPNLHGQTRTHRLTSHLANRAGILSFANTTLLMICSARNNLIMQSAKWSYRTMLLLHRWIAYLTIFEASLHTVIYIQHHLFVLSKKFTQAYWNWGFVAATLMLALFPLSSLPVRARAYAFFIDSHVFLSIVILSACYLHIILKFEFAWGYENWIYIPTVLWSLDRVIRLGKILRNGLHRAHITHIDDEYMRIHIANVRAAGHVYLYFPTLGRRFWQSHPFSIATSVHTLSALNAQVDVNRSGKTESSSTTSGHKYALADPIDSEDDEEIVATDQEKLPTDGQALLGSSGKLGHDQEGDAIDELTDLEDAESPDITACTGITLFVRRQRGITDRLFRTDDVNIRVLVEGPYAPFPIPSLATCPTFVCIAGGVGITAVLPPLTFHASIGRSVLYWSCRSKALVEHIDLAALRRAGVQVHVRIGERWDVQKIVIDEARTALSRGDVIVMSSGPHAMADDIRAAVSRVNWTVRGCKGRVRLVEECFSW